MIPDEDDAPPESPAALERSLMLAQGLFPDPRWFHPAVPAATPAEGL